jgi:hypothetical protein
VIAGSWLIASVCMPRTTQMSSAILAVCGRMSLISMPARPCLRKPVNEPAIGSTPW